MGTVAALAEGVMDMVVRPRPRSQRSKPQAGLGAGEGSQGAVVPAQPLWLLGKGTWCCALAQQQLGHTGNSQRASKAWCQPGESQLCQGTRAGQRCPRPLSNPPPSRSPR